MLIAGSNLLPGSVFRKALAQKKYEILQDADKHGGFAWSTWEAPQAWMARKDPAPKRPRVDEAHFCLHVWHTYTPEEMAEILKKLEAAPTIEVGGGGRGYPEENQLYVPGVYKHKWWNRLIELFKNFEDPPVYYGF